MLNSNVYVFMPGPEGERPQLDGFVLAEDGETPKSFSLNELAEMLGAIYDITGTQGDVTVDIPFEVRIRVTREV